MMRASKEAIKLIRDYEGYSTTAYICPAGRVTIGFGHTQGVKLGDTCTKAQAEKWFKADLKIASVNLERILNASKVEVTQGQFDALISFIFNFGAEKFIKSTLLKKMVAGQFFGKKGAEAEFKRWVHATDPKTGETVVLSGLVKRREAERQLFVRKP